MGWEVLGEWKTANRELCRKKKTVYSFILSLRVRDLYNIRDLLGVDERVTQMVACIYFSGLILTCSFLVAIPSPNTAIVPLCSVPEVGQSESMSLALPLSFIIHKTIYIYSHKHTLAHEK